MLANPIEAWEAVHSPDRVAHDAPVIGGLATLMQPFIYLMEHGLAESIGAEIKILQEAAAILLRRGPGPLHDPDRLDETARRIKAEIPRIERMRCAADLAEHLLGKHGWKYNQEKKTLLEIAPRGGTDFLNLIIRAHGIEYGTGVAGRERIKNELAPIFGGARLDATSRGNIARALENLKRPAKG